MKKFIKTGGIFTGVFALSFGIALATQYKSPKKNVKTNIAADNTLPDNDRPLSDKQRVLNSLLDIKAFELDGDVSIIATDNTTVGLDFSGKGDLSDLDNIKLQGKIDVALDSAHLKANFGYFDGEIFFDYNESYFRLETTKVLDFIDMLPTYGMNISIPSEIENLDLGMVESYVEGMSEKQLTPDGNNYYFTLEVGEEHKIPLYIITDLDLNFEGVRTGTIDYEGMIFKLNAKLKRVNTVLLENPKEDAATYAKYQDFSPAFKLFDGLYALTSQKKNTINADLRVRKYEEVGGVQVAKNVIGTNLDLTYDLESNDHLYALEGKVVGERKDENNNVIVTEVPYSFALYQKSIYAHYGDIAIKVQTDSLSALLEYILEKIGDEKILSLVESFTSTMSASQITDLVAKANNLLGTVVLTSDELGINLNTSNFSTTETDENGNEVDKLKLTDTYVSIKFNPNSGALESISLMNFGINNYEGDLVITFPGYKGFALDNVNYQSIDHLFPAVALYDLYKDMTQFRIEFDATISKDSTLDENNNVVNYNDITIDGGLQFELDPLRGQDEHINVGYGYGDLQIVDRKNVKHNIKADMKNVNEILLSYTTVIGDTKRDNNTDPMNVKFKIQTLKDLVEVVSELVKNPDDHLNEIMGALLNKTSSMPIEDIMAGDYLQLLTTNIVNRFEVGSDYVEIDIGLDILSMADTSFTIRIELNPTADGEGFTGLKALKISNLSFNGLNIEFNAYLKDFDANLESTRLSPAEEYIDFSDLKVLLQLGINTSKNNYYHFNAEAKLVFTLGEQFNFDIKEIPIDVKVWTKKGDVKVSVDIDPVPVMTLFSKNSSADDRVAHIYYHDKVFYVNRTETFKKLSWTGYKTHFVEHASKYHTDEFFENIITILCDDVLGLNSLIMSIINSSVKKNNTEDYQMKYENILNDFLYSKSGHYFYFDINLVELTNNDQLETLNVKVLTDNSNTNLTGANINLGISLGIGMGIRIELQLNLADANLVADSSNDLVALNAFEERMASYNFGRNEDVDTIL